MDPAPPQLAGENLAACLREDLAAARKRGEDFNAAWHAAMATLPLDSPHRRAVAQMREVEGWRAALRWARPHFERAYAGEAVQGAELAARDLEQLAA